ncbi:MAG: nucleotidyltransferase family protein, partial [Acidobacteriota bacterium]
MHADAPVWLLRLVRADPLGSVPQAVWPSLIELAQKLDVSGLVAHRALSAARPTDDELVETLRRQRQLAMRRTGFFSAEAARALEALDARGVVSLVLKGVSLARTVYEHPAERSFRDIDLLVAPEDVATALDALAEIGYSSKDTPAI